MPIPNTARQTTRPNARTLTWAGRVSVAGTGAIAAAAFWLSFTALRDLAARSGVITPWVWPLIVDGLIVVATIAAVAMSGRRGTWYPWLLLTGGAILSVTANAIHATLATRMDVPPAMAAIVASVPPIVLVAVTHLTVVLTRPDHDEPSTDLAASMPVEAPEAVEQNAPMTPPAPLDDYRSEDDTSFAALMDTSESRWANEQAEASKFIIDYLTVHGGQAPAGAVTAAAVAHGLDAGAVKHARARSRNPRVISERGSRGWVWRTERAEDA